MNAERVALVPGGSGAIGSAAAERLAQDDTAVYVGFRHNADAATATVERIRGAGGSAEAVCLDVDDPDAAGRVCEHIHDERGRLDILVNCAAINLEAPALSMEDDTWKQTLDTNLSGAFRLCRAAGKFMMLQRWGRIVNISSVAAHTGGRGQVNYAASKAGLEAMTRVLALELGRKGVLANCVAPGVIETPMSERVRIEHGEETRKRIALDRFGSPNDVAEVVAFLVSEEAAYITGQVIRVDGGMGL